MIEIIKNLGHFLSILNSYETAFYVLHRNPNSGLESNYCRNPSGHSQAWCYVMKNGSRKWENCDMRTCTLTTTKTAATKEIKGELALVTSLVIYNHVIQLNWEM